MNTSCTRRLSLVGLMAAMSWSCGDGLGPGGVGGRYVLESVSAVRLPVTMTSGIQSYRIIADTIWFDEDGTGRQVMVQDWTGQPRQRLDLPFDYSFGNDRVEVTFKCPPNASCIRGPHLLVRRENGSLVATYPPHLQDQGNPSFFYTRGRR